MSKQTVKQSSLNKVMMRIHIAIVIALAGCAHLSEKQSTCENQYDTFVQIFECTKQAVLSDSKLKNDSDTKLYLLKGEQLSQQVKRNEILDIDAKVEWQSLYNELERIKETKALQNMRQMEHLKPRVTNCISNGNTLNCTTY